MSDIDGTVHTKTYGSNVGSHKKDTITAQGVREPGASTPSYTEHQHCTCLHLTKSNQILLNPQPAQ